MAPSERPLATLWIKHKTTKPVRNERVWKNGIAESLRCLFLLAHLAAGGALTKHLVLHRRLLKKGAAAKFLEDPGAFVFLFEPAERPVDRLMLLDDNTYQSFSFEIGTALTVISGCWFRNSL